MFKVLVVTQNTALLNAPNRWYTMALTHYAHAVFACRCWSWCGEEAALDVSTTSPQWPVGVPPRLAYGIVPIAGHSQLSAHPTSGGYRAKVALTR